MKIKIDRAMKILLLRAIQSGSLDTETIPEFRGFEPARILTKEEAKELWSDLENGKFNLKSKL